MAFILLLIAATRSALDLGAGRLAPPAGEMLTEDDWDEDDDDELLLDDDLDSDLDDGLEALLTTPFGPLLLPLCCTARRTCLTKSGVSPAAKNI